MYRAYERPSVAAMAIKKHNGYMANLSEKRQQYLPRFADKIMGKNLDPIFFSPDPKVIDYFYKADAICLFCEKPPKWYDLSFCSGTECWVLFSNDFYANFSFLLGRSILDARASKVLIVPFPILEETR